VWRCLEAMDTIETDQAVCFTTSSPPCYLQSKPKRTGGEESFKLRVGIPCRKLFIPSLTALFKPPSSPLSSSPLPPFCCCWYPAFRRGGGGGCFGVRGKAVVEAQQKRFSTVDMSYLNTSTPPKSPQIMKNHHQIIFRPRGGPNNMGNKAPTNYYSRPSSSK
jgi:hypothetical protein